jgi:hypothetical protein
LLQALGWQLPPTWQYSSKPQQVAGVPQQIVVQQTPLQQE